MVGQSLVRRRSRLATAASIGLAATGVFLLIAGAWAELITEITMNGPGASSIAVHPSGSRLYLAGFGDRRGPGVDGVEVLDAATYRRLRVIRLPHSANVVALGLSARYLVVAGVLQGREVASIVDTVGDRVLGWTALGPGATSRGSSARFSSTVVSGQGIAVIEVATGKPLAIVPSSPTRVVANPTSTRQYYLEGSEVRVFDTATDDLIAAVPVGRGAAELALSSRGDRLYVTNSRSGTISVIDTVDYRVDTVGPCAWLRIIWR
jgi:DNA-binding beta-propeller fold protein YncE